MADEISGARELAATWQKRHSRENLLEIDDEELSSDEEDDTDEGTDPFAMWFFFFSFQIRQNTPVDRHSHVMS